MDRFLNQVFWGDARRLLRALPTASIDACITDPMFGVARNYEYDWGFDPARGDPAKHWQIHGPLYRECLRILRPGGILAWAQSFKFIPFFDDWFGHHRVWSPLCTAQGLNFVPNTWVVQTKEQRPLEHPNNMVVFVDRNGFFPLKKLHPCSKSVEELKFLIEALTRPGDIILDCFAGTGSTLVAAQRLSRRWIGCDLSRAYCRTAMRRLAGLPVTMATRDGSLVRNGKLLVTAPIVPRVTPGCIGLPAAFQVGGRFPPGLTEYPVDKA